MYCKSDYKATGVLHAGIYRYTVKFKCDLLTCLLTIIFKCFVKCHHWFWDIPFFNIFANILYRDIVTLSSKQQYNDTRIAKLYAIYEQTSVVIRFGGNLFYLFFYFTTFAIHTNINTITQYHIIYIQYRQGLATISNNGVQNK